MSSDSACELFHQTICLGVFVILLLNVMELFSVGGGSLLDRFCLCLCMSEVIPSFKNLRARSHVFALLMLFLCVILHNMWSGNSLQIPYILHVGILCLFAIRKMFVKIILVVCMLVGMVD